MPASPSHGVLIHRGENDYELAEDQTSVWLTVDGVSVYVRRSENSVIVELLPHGDEAAGDVLDTCAAPLDPGHPRRARRTGGRRL